MFKHKCRSFLLGNRPALMRFIFCIYKGFSVQVLPCSHKYEWNTHDTDWTDKKNLHTIKPGFCSWVYWLLKVAKCYSVQVCDARNDAQRTVVWLKKKLLQNLG